MTPIPSINKVYSMIVDHESQSIIASGSFISQVTNTLEAITFFTHKSRNKGIGVYLGPGGSSSSYSANNMKPVGSYVGRLSTSNYRSTSQKRILVVCEFCGYNGHTREQCFKLISYPTY